MMAVANRIFVHPDYAEHFEDNFRNRAGMVDRMPGFISNQVLRPVNDGDPYIVYTLWETRDHFEAWIASDAFVHGHARSGSLPKEAFTGPNKLEMHEVIQDSSRPLCSLKHTADHSGPIDPNRDSFRPNARSTYVQDHVHQCRKPAYAQKPCTD